MPEQAMTVKEVAHEMRVIPLTVYRWINSGAIPGVIRIGHTIRIPRESFRQISERQHFTGRAFGPADDPSMG